MKPLFFNKLMAVPLLYAFVFWGRSKKSDPEPDPILYPTFQFTANGTTYNWNGVGQDIISYGPIIRK